ncbi:MAG: TIGR00159 family protein [Deltaproteobacteria bacterium]|nr:MAG: TIGR00159 family protein [Deltaproteobacteria bacterium]
MFELLTNFRWFLDLLDILLVAFIIYRIMLLIKGTRAVQMLVGLAVLLLVFVASQLGGLYTLNWILNNFLSSIILVIVVLFQHDIRRALIHVGRNPFFADLSFREETRIIDELCKGCFVLSQKSLGALIVIERETGINNFLEVGIELDAKPSSDLIHSIFHHSSPMHDGAVIIQRGRLTRAGCFLPLTHDPDVNPSFGTRHRAAIGLTELVDAVVIVVSEETGLISVVVGGKITRALDVTTLKKVLNRLLEPRRLRGKKN